MDITGGEFKALEVQEQVQFVNDCVAHGYSIETIRKRLDIGKNYIANTFKREGYTRDKATGMYIKINTTTEEKTPKTTTNNKPTTNKTKGIKPSDKSNKVNVLETKVNALESEIEDIKTVLNEVNSKLNKVINTNNTTTYITVENVNSLGIKKLKGNKVTRSYKLNEKVQKEFKTFCKAHSDCEVGDILATALIEYMERNK